MQMFTGMAGYDEFLAGAFWFFRGLLVASVLSWCSTGFWQEPDG